MLKKDFFSVSSSKLKVSFGPAGLTCFAAPAHFESAASASETCYRQLCAGADRCDATTIALEAHTGTPVHSKMIESEYSRYSEEEFEGESEDEGVERSPKGDHHSSGHHSLSRSPDANSANSLTANPSTPSTTGNVRRVRMKRTSRNSSKKAAKTRQTVSTVPHHRPVTPAAVSAIKHRVSQIGAMSTKSKYSANTSPKRTGTIISMAAPSPLERVIFAKQERITALTNQLAMKDMEIDELRKENKLLKTVQYRQEKALDRFQNAEAELPQLVNRHAMEMTALRQRLKKSQDGVQAAEHKMREQNEEIWKLKVMLNEVTKLSGDKHLLERDRLRQMLNRANEKLEEKTKRANVSTCFQLHVHM